MSTLKVPLVSVTHGRNDETLERIYIDRRFKNHFIPGIAQLGSPLEMDGDGFARTG